jgi:subtilisin family serine protease
LALFVLLGGLALVAGQAGAMEWRARVDPALLAAVEEPGQVEFILLLTEQADLSPAAGLSSKAAKGAFVFQRLRQTAANTQQHLLAELSDRGIRHQSFWIVNAVLIRAEGAILPDLARRSDVAYIYANPAVAMNPPRPAEAIAALDAAAIEWNVQLVGAPALWAISADGRDVVIGGQDTGYEWDHPALKNQYRGWEGRVADHDYNWHDAIHDSSGPCGSDSPEPCDDHGHGTHTMGTMVGDDGGANRIGVAPGARWIGCRNMDRGVGTPATYIECFQWFVAPTRIDDTDPDPSKAPHVINNSWSCPPSEGCTDPAILRQAVENVRAAGIMTVQAAGNSGYSGCGSIDTPAAIYEATFTVGATNSSDLIAAFSSRGPVTVDGSGRLKPDVVAPGVSVRSSALDGGYTSMSGTSMAAPHVAGLAALLISAQPELSGDVDRLEQAISHTAVPRFSAQSCGDWPGDQTPNAVYGYGRIDAQAAARFLTGPHWMFPLIINSLAPGQVQEGAR